VEGPFPEEEKVHSQVVAVGSRVWGAHAFRTFSHGASQRPCTGGAGCRALEPIKMTKSSLVYTPHKQRGITRIDFGSDLV
jgi:hypothetical protein